MASFTQWKPRSDRQTVNTRLALGKVVLLRGFLRVFVSPFQYYSTMLRTYLLSFFIWRNSRQWARASSFTRFLDHTQRRITVGRTPLDEWSARRRDLYPTTHNTHNRQTSMFPMGFEPTISAGERPQTHALDRVATGTDLLSFWLMQCNH